MSFANFRRFWASSTNRAHYTLPFALCQRRFTWNGNWGSAAGSAAISFGEGVPPGYHRVPYLSRHVVSLSMALRRHSNVVLWLSFLGLIVPVFPL